MSVSRGQDAIARCVAETNLWHRKTTYTYTYDQGLHTADDPGQNFADGNKLTLTRLDAMGRVMRQKQEVSGVHVDIPSTFSTQYAYNLAGLLTSTAYPNERVVATGYDTGGQPTIVTSGGVMVAAVEDGPDPAAPAVTLTGYGPHRGMQRMRYGVGGPVEALRYNGRLQMTSLQVADPLAARMASLTLTYGFGAGAVNNGNLIRQEIVSPVGNFTQNYEYDGIGRLLKFSEGTKVEENVYDGYGNRAVYTEHARSKIRKDAPIHPAIGGFHLFNAKEETLVFTARKFREFGLQGFLGAHCTGIESVYRLRELAGLGRMSAAVGALGGGFDLETGLNPGAIAR